MGSAKIEKNFGEDVFFRLFLDLTHRSSIPIFQASLGGSMEREKLIEEVGKIVGQENILYSETDLMSLW